KVLARGNVTLSLRLTRSDFAANAVLNPGLLTAALDALARIEAEAQMRGVDLAPSRASDLLCLRGMMEAGSEAEDYSALVSQLKAELRPLIAAFLEMRRAEGKALEKLLRGQLDQVVILVGEAATLAEARKSAMADTLRANLARVLDNIEGADPDRVAQELALIAVKADVTEELDRLRAHVEAARELLDNGGAVGRKLDFLMQEFNREANTLCSKSQNSDLTRVGLDLKAVIDQMREQVQNVE
ncbi:MAG: YicC/YloC family endoribonuclease, partial [Pseudodonghicola sp.]